ncbi:recombinase family protein [Afipia birgiae]|jgi:DNA invertase Pin-like site-specific DNA recombinase|uniref:recombinase family protein n=1 Tax=Afipia birgiae TaxID=151414 RepID=UPI000377E2C3|nr:recombinase family protein [Afipia birgiae]
MISGYARVSTNDQDTAAQVEQLMAAGAVKVFREKISGATAERPQLKKALASLDQAQSARSCDFGQLKERIANVQSRRS